MITLLPQIPVVWKIFKVMYLESGSLGVEIGMRGEMFF
jgi:hypothetical protein